LNFFPVDCILLFEHPWIKKASTAYADMARAAVPKLFERSRNLSLVNAPQTTTQALNNVWKNNHCRPIGDFWE